MSVYPMYIPIYYGGRGPPDPKGTLIGLGIVVLSYGLYVHYQETPRFKMTMKWQNPPYGKCQLNVKIKHTNKFPHIVSIEHKGFECMEKKGYNIKANPERLSPYSFKPFNLSYDEVMSSHVTKIGNPIDKEKFKKDCKECGVTTEFQYNYKDRWHTKSYEWDKCSITELK